LLEAGLVAERRVGRERYYRLRPGSLREVREWVNRYDGFWMDRLGALGEHLERQPG
jgi:DNA-binding transcriptional ArsR family regulator